jgi:hypothetical protein
VITPAHLRPEPFDRLRAQVGNAWLSTAVRAIRAERALRARQLNAEAVAESEDGVSSIEGNV